MRGVTLAIALALLLPEIAGAHAVLVKSSPARRAVLAAPPTRVELTFNERLEPAYSTVSVWAAGDVRVDDGKIVIAPDNPRRVSVGLPALKHGNYTVKYRVLSVDGHVVEGAYPFEIRPRPPSAK
jgi:methionine-rich copper-binding protein CopC